MHHFTPVERAGEPGGDLRRHSQTGMGHCHPNLGILWLIQSHCSQQQLLEEPASPGMDALGCRGNLSRSAGGDIPPGYPKLTKNALIYTAPPVRGTAGKRIHFHSAHLGTKGDKPKAAQARCPFYTQQCRFFMEERTQTHPTRANHSRVLQSSPPGAGRAPSTTTPPQSIACSTAPHHQTSSRGTTPSKNIGGSSLLTNLRCGGSSSAPPHCHREDLSPVLLLLHR